jgi:CDP-diacylglycerol pyrophosphatase
LHAKRASNSNSEARSGSRQNLQWIRVYDKPGPERRVSCRATKTIERLPWQERSGKKVTLAERISGKLGPAKRGSKRAGSEDVAGIADQFRPRPDGVRSAFSTLGLLAASLAREALWLTIQACVADTKLTGSPFPCLLVDLSGGENRGHVVLRAPFGPPDTILAPTRRVVGVEDPWLRSDEAPNYFDAAWRARALVVDPDGKPPEPYDFALAVNSALARSQDQFHIHLGCLVPVVKRRLSELVPRLPIGAWTRVDVAIAGSAFWALRTGHADVAAVDPLRLAVEGLAGKLRNQARLTILVADTRVADHDETLIFASYASASGSLSQVSAENILDPACSGRSRPSGSN